MWNPVRHYAFAVAVTALAFLLTLWIASEVGHPIYQLAVVAVVLSAWRGGLGPGLVSASLSALCIMFFLLEPRGSFNVRSWEQSLQIVVFAVVAIVLSGLSQARHQAERKLRLRTEELEAANHELEAFSYTVSHDLRRPLRIIDGYSQILLNEYASQLSAEAQRYLQSVRTSTQHLGKLVDDLLEFSRLGRQALHVRTIEPSELVRQCLDDLKSEQERRQVSIRMTDLPACQADPVLLKQVFVNLLHNAMKFTRRRHPALIEVGCWRLDGREVYYVKDNGVGFDMQYAHRLFGSLPETAPFGGLRGDRSRTGDRSADHQTARGRRMGRDGTQQGSHLLFHSTRSWPSCLTKRSIFC